MIYAAILIIILVFGFISFIPSKNQQSGIDLFDQQHTMIIRALMAFAIVVSHIAAQTNVGTEIPYGRVITNVISGGGALGVALFFFVSGYGNYISVAKTEKSAKKYIRWVCIRIIKIIICFIFAYIYDCLVLFVVNHKLPENLAVNFLTLSMPGTTTWYLKIQLIYYIVLAICSWFLIDKEKWFYICLFILSIAISLPFYITHSNWWNGYTGLCFAAGVYLAKNGSAYRMIVERNKRIAIIVGFIVFVICYYLTLSATGGYVVQNIIYICLCCSISTICLGIVRNISIWKMIGAASLSVYLVHIGQIKGVFNDAVYNEKNMIIFIFATFIGSIIVDLVSKYVMQVIIPNKKNQKRI